MKTYSIRSFFIVTVMFIAGSAAAQASRTWVSGVGDDVNPCSRTAPCKTFAGAISKTADGGEIDTLDPGGFGAVTITKNIVIDGTGGGESSVLVSGTSAIVINDAGYAGGPNTIRVVLRNLQINGIGSGLIAINFVSGKSLLVEGCFIYAFSGKGISVTNSGTNTQIDIRDTTVQRTADIGVSIDPSAGNVMANLNNVRIGWGDNSAVLAGTNTNMTIVGSNLSNNVFGAGVAAKTNSSIVSISESNLSNNAYGLYVGITGTPTIRLQRTTITENTISGINITVGGSTVIGYQSNTISGNAGNNNVTSSVAAQ